VKKGQRGELLLAALPNKPLAFTVTRVSPVTIAAKGRNAFRVEAQLDQAATSLRPGMEGVARTQAEPQLLAWIWTRRLIDWARLQFWRWWP
jgi:hypothetical protein